MTARVTSLILLCSIFFGAQARTVYPHAIIKTEKNPSIKKIAGISLITGIIAGSLAACNESYGLGLFVGLSALFGPLCTTVASIIITTILSGNVRIASFLLPGYIVTPTFYLSWLIANRLLKQHALSTQL